MKMSAIEEKNVPAVRVSDFGDDVRQSFVVMKNEIRKFMRGRKMLIFTALVALILVAITAVVIYSEHGLGDDGKELSSLYLGFSLMIVLIAATLFTSTSIVSEFEERTALILFTKPIRKWSIYLGKFLASIVVVVGFTVVYYLIVAALCAVPGLDDSLWQSLAAAVCYGVAASGVALLISSFMKKSSTASIMTFMTLLLLISVITLVLAIGGVDDAWFMLDNAQGAVTGVLSSDGYGHLGRECGVMLAWGAATIVAGYFLFKRRQF